MVYGFMMPIYLVLGLEENRLCNFYLNFSKSMLFLNTFVESTETLYCNHLVVE
jgi:hypothetical protein